MTQHTMADYLAPDIADPAELNDLVQRNFDPYQGNPMDYGQPIPDAAPVPPEELMQPIADAIPANHVKLKYYGPEVGDKPARDVLYGPTGKHLEPGQAAVSPNLAHIYPLNSPIAIHTDKGTVHAIVADYSYVKPGQPNYDTIELWNRKPGADTGIVTHLTPEMIQGEIAKAPKSASADGLTEEQVQYANAPDVSDASAPDILTGGLTDQVTSRQGEAHQPAPETAPIPKDLSQVNYDPSTDTATWEFGGAKWYLARNMKRPALMPGQQKEQPRYIKLRDGSTALVNKDDPLHPIPVEEGLRIGQPKGMVATDEEFSNLQAVDPAKASLVDSIAKYELMGGARGATLPPQIQKMLPELLPYVKKVNPTFSMEKAGERRVFLNQQWTSTNPNTAGGARTSANRLAQHMGEMADAFEALGNGDSAIKNYAKNLFSTTGPNRFEAARTTAAIMAQEAAKAVQGGAPNVAEIKRLVDGLSVNSAPATFKATMNQIMGLVSDQLRTQGSNYRTHMGKDVPDQQLIDPEAANSVVDLQKRGYYAKDQFGGRTLKNYFDQPESVTYSKDSMPAGAKPVADTPAAPPAPREVRRPVVSGPHAGQTAIMDADTHQFLRYE